MYKHSDKLELWVIESIAGDHSHKSKITHSLLCTADPRLGGQRGLWGHQPSTLRQLPNCISWLDSWPNQKNPKNGSGLWGHQPSSHLLWVSCLPISWPDSHSAQEDISWQSSHRIFSAFPPTLKLANLISWLDSNSCSCDNVVSAQFMTKSKAHPKILTKKSGQWPLRASAFPPRQLLANLMTRPTRMGNVLIKSSPTEHWTCRGYLSVDACMSHVNTSEIHVSIEIRRSEHWTWSETYLCMSGMSWQDSLVLTLASHIVTLCYTHNTYFHS